MSKKSTFKPLAAAIGSAFILSIAAAPASADTANPFGMSDLSSGYQQLAEGKCGAKKEGKCGGDKKAEAKCGGDKKAEGKCGGDKAKKAEGKCGDDKAKKKEGKCGEGKCGGKK